MSWQCFGASDIHESPYFQWDRFSKRQVPGKPSVPFFLATVAGFRDKVDGNLQQLVFQVVSKSKSNNPNNNVGINTDSWLFLMGNIFPPKTSTGEQPTAPSFFHNQQQPFHHSKGRKASGS